MLVWLIGGVLGTLMMVPLRRSLIVKEHGNLPYPEGTACASVLIAGEKGGDLAKIAFQGVGFAFVYALLQKIVKLIAETPALVTKQTNKFFPSATLNGDITPEYLGVGYIVGPKIAGVLVAEALAKGETISREQLLESVWGMDFDPNSNIVDVYVRALRKKIDAPYITTVRGAGYRFA